MPLSYAVIKNSPFRFLLTARTLTFMAMQAQAVIVGWQIYTLTRDPFILGLTGLAEALPAIACAFVAGHVVDISKPRRIYILCLAALALNAFGLLVVAGGVLPASRPIVLGWIFVGVFLAGIARSFTMPATFSLMPQVVPRRDIPAATSWMTGGFQISAIGGPAMAGLIYGGYGPMAAWVIPFSLLTLAFVFAFFLKVPKVDRSENRREPLLKSVKAGWKFIWKNPVLLSAMALDMFAVFFGGAVAMLPVFAHEVLHVGSQGLGALYAAPAMGAILIALYFALKPMKRMSAARLLWCVAGFGFAIIGFALSRSFWLSMAFLALSGAFDSMSVIIRGALLQLLTPDNMRGRVSSINSMFLISSNEMGAFESGLAAKTLGLVPSVVFGGIMTLMIVAGTALASPKFRKTVVRAEE